MADSFQKGERLVLGDTLYVTYVRSLGDGRSIVSTGQPTRVVSDFQLRRGEIEGVGQ
ncbi:hypothetical protein [Agromyces larvae]|uniref:Peptidylprolyl isomerase n=1 Tax=Agromyces larvae TaxID=2929802 RepID=A0ABY4C7J7_9MICO|nr:hypothetical protein [Agromyces larvae]UOE45973.1 hypothetical protein MTO99_09590 [Agromyces larvae]